MTSPEPTQPSTDPIDPTRPVGGFTLHGSGARRRSALSTWRRVSRITLIAGTVVALAAAFGPSWVVRAGVVIAVVAAVVATVAAWREIFGARRDYARTLLAASVDHGRVLSEERTRNGAVVDILRSRITEAGVVVDDQRTTIAELNVKVSALTGDKAYLRAEVDHREGVINSLRDTVRARESELVALREGPDAEVHPLPRRMLAERSLPHRVLAAHDQAMDALPAADELWTDGSRPTVIDLAMVEYALADLAVPNDEAGRQVS